MTILQYKDVANEVLSPLSYDFEWPWPMLHNATNGLRRGELVLVIGASGLGKCLGRDVEVRMFDGSTKRSQDVVMGDILMGPDSTPRVVKSTTTGTEQMYKIVPIKGEPYTCNESHILTLISRVDKYGLKKGQIYDIPLKEYLAFKVDKQKQLKTIRPEKINYPAKKVSIDPYLYGLWLGDGSKGKCEFTNPEKKLQDVWKAEIEKLGGKWSDWTYVGKCTTLGCDFGGGKGDNPLQQMRYDSVKENYKFINRDYLHNTQEVRFQLLAGLLDTDGYLVDNVYEIATVSPYLKEDILELGRSLGFMCTCRDKVVKGKVYYRIFISGHTDKIPLRLPRKKASSRQQIKDVLVSNFHVEKLGIDDYFGWTLDGDGRFLLKDFQITHNTEWTLDIAYDVASRQKKNVLVISTEQAPHITYRRVISKKLGVRIDLANHKASRNDVNHIGENLPIYTFKTTGALQWDTLEYQLKDAIKKYDIDLLVIDNLSSISAAFKSGRKTLAEALGDTAIAIKELAVATHTTVILVSHVSRRSGVDFDRGAPLSLSDVRSSEGPAQHCDSAYGIERNALSSDPELRNFVVVRNLKERMYGQARGREFYFRYCFSSCSFTESPKLECKIDTDLLLETLYHQCVKKFSDLIREFKESNESYDKFFGGKTNKQEGFEANFKLGALTLYISDRSRPSIVFDAPYVLEGARSFKRFADKVTKADIHLKWFMKQLDLAHQRMFIYFDDYQEFKTAMLGLFKAFDVTSVYMGERKMVPSFFGDYDAGVKMHFTLTNAEVKVERPEQYLEGNVGMSRFRGEDSEVSDVF